jgi:murein DD-endopeptidase MepM/ murein hydrolase activator NlpD
MKWGVGAAAGVAAALLLLVPATPASADLLPTPLPLPLPSLLPTPAPVPVPLPLPAPVPSVVAPVVTVVPVATPVPGAGAPAPSGAPVGGDPSTAPPSSDPPPAQPSPAEAAALPSEPQRVALEGQAQRLASVAPDLDQRDDAAAALAGGGGGRFTWPIAFAGHPPMTQRFGCTDVPGEPYSPDCATHRIHTGIDLGVHTGTPVYAAAGGVAHVFRSDTGYGNHVLVAHGGGWFTLYAHLSQSTVREGEAVRRGDPVGLSGSTGFSTGPHLHFEIRYGEHPQDPCIYLDC